MRQRCRAKKSSGCTLFARIEKMKNNCITNGGPSYCCCCCRWLITTCSKLLCYKAISWRFYTTRQIYAHACQQVTACFKWHFQEHKRASEQAKWKTCIKVLGWNSFAGEETRNENLITFKYFICYHTTKAGVNGEANEKKALRGKYYYKARYSNIPQEFGQALQLGWV